MCYRCIYVQHTYTPRISRLLFKQVWPQPCSNNQRLCVAGLHHLLLHFIIAWPQLAKDFSSPRAESAHQSDQPPPYITNTPWSRDVTNNASPGSSPTQARECRPGKSGSVASSCPTPATNTTARLRAYCYRSWQLLAVVTRPVVRAVNCVLRTIACHDAKRRFKNKMVAPGRNA